MNNTARGAVGPGLLTRLGIGIATGCGLGLVSCGDRAPADGGTIRVEASFGEIGTSNGAFDYPRAMAAVPAGAAGVSGPTLVVIDKTARVQRFDAKTGEYLGGFRMPVWGLGKPTGVSVGPDPRDPTRLLLWVADTHYHRVLAYDIPAPSREQQTVEPVFAFGEYGNEPGQFVYPTDVQILTHDDGSVDRVLVSEYGGNDRVTVFRPELSDDGGVRMTPLGTIGRFGNAGEDDADGALVFVRPQNLEFDEALGLVVVVDSLNHRIVRLRLDDEASATLVDVFGGPSLVGRALGELDHPYSVAVLADSTVLVAEFGACRVQRLDLNAGVSLGGYGRPGRRVGELVNPWEVVVIDKLAWVLDSGNNRVVAFESPERGAP
ncbi:MAG: hypothetical protein ACI89L_001091 [Phycisphaerales bacterium]|jgi:hypothetical protein